MLRLLSTCHFIRPRDFCTLFAMMGLELAAPDHTTLSRRGQHDLTRARVLTGKGLYLIVDSTGLSTVGEGEWASAKRKTERAR